MRLSLKQLKQLSVETPNGVVLGYVTDVVFDTEGQLLVQYIVKPSLLQHIRPQEYLINRDQIIRFEEKRVLVDENVSTAPGTPDKQSVKPLTPEPLVMRNV